LDLHLRAERANEAVECDAFGGADVGRGYHSYRSASLAGAQQLGLEESKPVPLHECTDEVDLVRAAEFGPQLRTQPGFAGGIGEQRGIRERRARPAQ